MKSLQRLQKEVRFAGSPTYTIGLLSCDGEGLCPGLGDTEGREELEDWPGRGDGLGDGRVDVEGTGGRSDP